MRVAIEGLPSVNEDASDIDAADPGVLDTDSLAFLRRDMEERSVATTRLASEVGSVMGAPKIPRVKSFTFYAGKDTDDDDDESDNNVPVDWNMELKDGQIRRKARVLVDSVRGSMAEWCGIRAGDHLKSINGTDISAKWDAARAKQHMQTCLTEDGYLSVAAVDPDGDEVWIRATIIKPNPEATLADLGMTVWYWGYLCIKSIDKESIFKRTVLKSTDHIVSVNDIVCDNMKADGFAHVVRQLPREITVTVLRRKQRFTGMFK